MKKAIICFMLLSCIMMVTHVNAAPMLYTDWELLLQRCVDKDGVNYKLLNENQYLLYIFIDDIANVSEADYVQWEDKDRIAFWINAYNACALTLLLTHKDITDLRDIEGGWEKVTFTVFGRTMTLAEMKHTYLRGYFQDERVQFALSAPARSFPQLRNEAYVGEQLNLLLEGDILRFLVNKSNFKIMRESHEVYLSEILKWFGKDFLQRYDISRSEFKRFSKNERAIINFISNYVSDEDRTFLLSGNYRIEYIPFNWDITRSDLYAVE